MPKFEIKSKKPLS